MLSEMRTALLLTFSVIVATAAGCDPSTAPTTTETRPAPLAVLGSPTPTASLATYRECRGGVHAPTTGRGFEHKRSHLVAAATPNHSVQDFFAAPGTLVTLSAKLAYGDIGKDLEDEAVEIMLDDCSALAVRGTAKTDDDGLATLEITAPELPGAYELRFRVIGDGSDALSTLHVLPPGTELVVFDIDGTLTTDDAEVTRHVLDEHFGHIRDGNYVAAAYAHGAELAQLWSSRGFIVVYLTGRPYWLVEHTRAWLRDGGYPEGLVRTTLRQRDVVPNVAGVGEFKASFLKSLTAAGHHLVAAHGNATTDVWAYAQAGVPANVTYIIGPHAGAEGTIAVRDDWSSVVEVARAHRPASQPFVRP